MPRSIALDPTRGEDLRTAEDRRREAFRADVKARLAALASVRIEDDGSFATQFADRPGLANALLGRCPLDPADLDWATSPVSNAPLEPDAVPTATLPVNVQRLVEVRGAVGVRDLDETLEAIISVRARVNALEAFEGVLLERARRQALCAEGLLNESEPMVRSAGRARRADLARRTLVAEVALATRQGEQTVSARMLTAQALVARAPRTLTTALTGDAAWANAVKVADAVADLDPRTAARLDDQVVAAAACQNTKTFARTVRRTRDRLCPTPAEVRHAEAATKRGVWTDPARDGMAYLTLLAPAPAVHAITDRLSTVARSARSEGDGRTLAQLRADVACALLLDDGTLDLRAASVMTAATKATSAVMSPSAQHAGEPAGQPTSQSTSEPTVTGRLATDRLITDATKAHLATGLPTDADDAHAGHAADYRGRTGGTAAELARIARSVRPKVYVTVPVLTLLGRVDEPALLDGDVPIDPETAREMAGLASSFTRLLTHPHTGKVLGVSAETYRPPAELRHFIKVRDTSCRFPGCTRPAATTDADHTVAHAEGGPTASSNLAHLCHRHHVLKHQARFAVRQIDDEGTLTWTTPTGRRHTTSTDLIPATIHRERPRFPDMSAPDGDEPQPPEFAEPPPDFGDPSWLADNDPPSPEFDEPLSDFSDPSWLDGDPSGQRGDPSGQHTDQPRRLGEPRSRHDVAPPRPNDASEACPHPNVEGRTIPHPDSAHSPGRPGLGDPPF
ncbi:HNH endonuclease signature motif containing protein [Xylanimonas ulmi]|uniref:Uncharacterized protein DUF222 n=1 Tax=Xylanimonas ulmi TaxID=228973 RepID=A0A4Q7M5K7_9MICO|nr:HNH endonuclease signature motif containing protein [Xylanibacterium ulmi]RZS62721.1 uncharacterized protein DUF222 [Xylanibacterium ulmi]